MQRSALSSTVVAGLALLLMAGWTQPSQADWWKHRGRNSIKGSGHFVKQNRNVDSFDAIRLEGVADIHIRKGDRISVEVEAEDNLIDLVLTDVRRGRLIVRMDEDHTINTDEGIHINVTLPVLRELELQGVGGIDATDLDEEELLIDVEGVGNLTLSGRVADLDLSVSGVGNVDLRDLVATDARVRHSGVGNVQVHARNELDVRVSGIGSVRYFGDPEHVSRREEGMGRISAARGR